MKWVLGYCLGTIVLLAPAAARLWLRGESAPQPLSAADVAEGKMLFTHEWKENDPLAPHGDGLGPVFNASSCAQCHTQGGLGGSGLLQHNVTTFFVPGPRGQQARQGVVHAHAVRDDLQENLSHAHSGLPALVRPSLQTILPMGQGAAFGVAEVSQRNTPALFGAKLIDELPEHVILANARLQKLRWKMPDDRGQSAPIGRPLILAGGKIGKFGWKGQSATLLDFVQAACANELGLGNPSHAQPAPLALASYKPRGLDLTQQQCEQMSAFIAALPRPVERAAENANVHRGRGLFHSVGCAECHVPNMGSLQGVYSDFLLHRMGDELTGGGSYHSPPPPDSSPGDSPFPDEWRTPPLWGVADSAPYLHDGRAPTLRDAILAHRGQARQSSNTFGQLGVREQQDLLDFLGSLRAPH
jgi:CxxC motif-containing protein (DUF1111 family)